MSDYSRRRKSRLYNKRAANMIHVKMRHLSPDFTCIKRIIRSVTYYIHVTRNTPLTTTVSQVFLSSFDFKCCYVPIFTQSYTKIYNYSTTYLRQISKYTTKQQKSEKWNLLIWICWCWQVVWLMYFAGLLSSSYKTRKHATWKKYKEHVYRIARTRFVTIFYA